MLCHNSSFCSAYDCFLVRANYVYLGEAYLFSFTISEACEVPGYDFPHHLVYASTDPENLPATTFASLRNLFRMSHLLMYLFHRRSSQDVALDPSLGPSRAVGLLSSLLNWGGRLRPLPPMSPPQAQRFVDPDSSDSALF